MARIELAGVEHQNALAEPGERERHLEVLDLLALRRHVAEQVQKARPVPGALGQLAQKLTLGGLGGSLLLLAAVNQWRLHAWGRLDYADTMRLVVPGVTLASLGYETVLACFLLGLLQMKRR